MAHIILLGDSIFDNAAYVAGGPDVVAQLRAKLPAGWQATLLAVDGATAGGVARQLQNLPQGATHLVVSVGGNDALGHLGVLDDEARSVSDALNRLADIGDAFRSHYRLMLESVLGPKLPTVLCSIYEPRFPQAELQRVSVTGLALFNDIIIREAFEAGLPLLDLRLICGADEDYADPIEPSVKGGEKISAAILAAVTAHDFGRGRTEVFVR